MEIVFCFRYEYYVLDGCFIRIQKRNRDVAIDSGKVDEPNVHIGGAIMGLVAFTKSPNLIFDGRDDVCEFFIGFCN